MMGLIVMGALGLGGCGKDESLKNTTENGLVEKEGVLKMKSGDEYLMNTDGGIINITSNKVNLDELIGKSIKVKGMYSGSTLYVDEVE